MGNFSTWLNTVTLPEFSDLVKKQFIHVQENFKPVAAQLYNFEDLTSHNEDSKRYDEVDVEMFASTMLEGENAKKAKAGVGYNKTMYAKRIAKEIDISWNMRRYGNGYKVKNQLTSLTGFVPNRRELDLTHRFSFGTSTSFTDMDGYTIDTTMGDGYALAYSAHKLAFSTTTYRNRVSGDPAFSQTGLELAEVLFTSDIYTNFGDNIPMVPDVIFSTNYPLLTNDIRRVLESTADVDGAHAGIDNVYAKKYRHVILPYLDTSATGAKDSTKKRWWGLAKVGANGLQAYYGIFESENYKTPAPGNNGEDIHNDNWTYGVRESHGSVIVSGRGLVMSCPVS